MTHIPDIEKRECDICGAQKEIHMNDGRQPKDIDYGPDGVTLYCDICWEDHEEIKDSHKGGNQ